MLPEAATLEDVGKIQGLKAGKKVWMGAMWKASSGDVVSADGSVEDCRAGFKWVSSGVVVNESLWKNGEPDNCGTDTVSENCVGLYNGVLESIPCANYVLDFIHIICSFT